MSDAKLFLDTNVLIENPDYFDEMPFIISDKTLFELEEIKSSRSKADDVRSAARKAIRFLNEHKDQYDVIVYNNSIKELINSYNIPETPDNIICACARWYTSATVTPIKFITFDVGCRVIAEKVFNLDVEEFEHQDEIYKGYVKITGDTEYINNYMNNLDYSKWYTNEYIIINNTDDGSIKEMRFDGTMFVPLKLPPSKYIKGKNSLQRCGLDLLNNQNITICALLGTPGGGKDYLSVRYGVYAVQEKGYQQGITVCREPISSGRESGYLPGTLDEKIGLYFKPIEEQLNGKEFEFNTLQQRGQLEVITPHYIKGRTFISQYIICEESEDLTEKQIRLIGTRLGEESRIIFSGDYKQSEILNTKENSLIKMCNFFKGNPRFGCIYLEEDVRSTTSKMFANMYF